MKYTILRMIGGFLIGASIAALALVGTSKFKELQSHVDILTETVVYMSSHVIMQDMVIEDMKKKIDKMNGTRAVY